MRLFDTNVILDIFTDDPSWAAWSMDMLVGSSGPRLINAVIYAELSSRFHTEEALDAELSELALALADIPRMASFRAGQAFFAYRQAGGPRARLLPDFLIGAHAAAIGAVLVTRNPRDYRTYFPDLTLITP